MKPYILALIIALFTFGATTVGARADGSYSGYPDWAKEAFEGADDKGGESD
ncbi:MAG: hypothetical protein RLZ98_808 [Pseudomonadota bacterium]|jgi:hypothetical protein